MPVFMQTASQPHTTTAPPAQQGYTTGEGTTGGGTGGPTGGGTGVTTAAERKKVEKGRRKGQCAAPFLRFLPLAAACCSFPVMIRATTGSLKYHDFRPFSFLVAGTVIAAFWALLTMLCDCLLLCMKRIVHSIPLLLMLVLGDFLAMFMALGGGSAAAGITTANDRGLPGRPFLCSNPLYQHYCVRSKVATGFAIIAAAFFVPVLAMDVSSLGRELYEEEEADRNKGVPRAEGPTV